MKLLLLIIPFFYFQNDCNHMQTVRNNFHRINSEEKLELFIEITDKSECKLKTPYLASSIMQTAQYTFWPTKKLKKFNRGKRMLESFIRDNPDNIEARYVRILVQSEAPGILGYNKNIKTDIEFIRLKIDDTNLPITYKNLILKNIENIIK